MAVTRGARILAAFGVVMIAACVRAPGSSLGDDGAAQSVAPVEQTPKIDCYDITGEVQGPTDHLANVVDVATAVIDGTFGGYGEARWNTPGGERPTPAEVQETTARLLRPLKINVNNTIEGAAAAAGHAVSRGGKLGCDSVSYSDDQTLTVGERYVFFLAPITDSRAKLTADMLAFEAWPVDAAGNVAVPNAGTLTFVELMDALERGIAPSEPPSPGEPPETYP